MNWWRSKYFRGRRIHGDWDVRVEQAEFRELSITASTDNGATVSMAVYRSGTKVVRCVFSLIAHYCFANSFQNGPPKLNFFFLAFLVCVCFLCYPIFLVCRETHKSTSTKVLSYVGVTMMESRTRQRELEAFSKKIPDHKNLWLGDLFFLFLLLLFSWCPFGVCVADWKMK